MNLLLQDALSGPAVPPTARNLGAPAADAWQREWRAAQATVPGGAAFDAAPQVRVPAEDKELERCGMPVGTQANLAGNAAVPIHIACPAEDRAPSPHALAHSQERARVRLHVDPGPGHGLRIWLGIDARPLQAGQVAQLALSGLREALQASGHRIELLVCNGQALVAAPRTAAGPQRTTASISNATEDSQ